MCTKFTMRTPNVMWCADGTCHFKRIELDETQSPHSAAQAAICQNVMTDTMYPTHGARIFRDSEEACALRVIEKISSTPYETYLTRTSTFLPDAEIVWLKLDRDTKEIIVESRRADDNRIIGLFVTDSAIGTYSPDGTTERWIPIPLPKAGMDILCTIKLPGYKAIQKQFGTLKAYTMLQSIAFGKNPWKHAVCSALTYSLYMNPTDNISRVTNPLSTVENNTMLKINGNVVLMVPVVPSGKDKLIYIVEHGRNSLNLSWMTLHVNDKPVENLRNVYMNPFSQHLNGRGYGTYLAAKIPANYVEKEQSHVKVNIDTKGCALFVTEIGTHDMFVQIPAPNYVAVKFMDGSS